MELKSLKDFSIWEVLDNQITYPSLPRYGNVHIYPSEASVKITNPETDLPTAIGGCLRKSWFRIFNQMITRGVTPDIEPWDQSKHSAQQLWKFEMSYLAERMIVEQAKRSGIYIANSVRFLIPELNIKGELDAVFWDTTNECLVGIEVKSIYGYYGEKGVFGSARDKKIGLKGKAKAENILQTALYAWFWRRTIPYFKLVYVSRGSADRAEFKLEIKDSQDHLDWEIFIDDVKQPYTINNIIDRTQEIMSYVEAGEIPCREYDLQYSPEYISFLAEKGLLSKTNKTKFDKGHKVTLGDWNCSYCDFKANCYKNTKPILDNIKEEFHIHFTDNEEIHTFASSYALYDFLNNHAGGEEDTEITFFISEEEKFTGTIAELLQQDRLSQPVRVAPVETG